MFHKSLNTCRCEFSQAALPQSADAEILIALTHSFADFDCQLLATNPRHAKRTLGIGAKQLSFIISASEKHSIVVDRLITASHLTEIVAGAEFGVIVREAFAGHEAKPPIVEA